MFFDIFETTPNTLESLPFCLVTSKDFASELLITICLKAICFSLGILGEMYSYVSLKL